MPVIARLKLVTPLGLRPDGRPARAPRERPVGPTSVDAVNRELAGFVSIVPARGPARR